MPLKLPERWRTGMQAVSDTPKNVQIIAVMTLLLLAVGIATLIVVSTKAGKK